MRKQSQNHKAISPTHQTFPIPEIKLAHGVESLFSNPAKAPSSRNGESWSSNSATRSRAVVNQSDHPYGEDVNVLTQQLAAGLMPFQRDFVSFGGDLLQCLLESFQYRHPAIFIGLEQFAPEVQVGCEHWE